MDFHSKLLNNAVEQMATLPGVGERTALRLVLDMLNRSESDVQAFTMAMTRLKNDIKFCKNCKNISETDLCNICNNPQRDETTICVIQDIRDILAIEATQQYKGLYHILGGIISPMDGIGPDDLHIASLIERASSSSSKEIILALSATMEGDTTNFYLFRKLKECNVNVSVISRGIGIGNELEYTDEVTLGRSILNRSPFQNSLAR
jgi:recombination protein RecR